jgi:hypothetical protein
MTNPNDPAFSQGLKNFDAVDSVSYHAGLSKREYFAAMAMQGLSAAMQPLKQIECDLVSEYCVQMADALIAELNKEPKA